MRVLIVKPSSLGDIAHALPVAAALQRRDRDCHIAWIVNDTLVPMLACAGDVDTCLPFRRREWGRGQCLGDLCRLLGDLRRQPYDLVLDLQGLLRSGLLARLARSGKRVGFAAAREGAERFYDQAVSVPPAIDHAVDKCLYLASRAVGEELAFQQPRWSLPAAAEAEADRLLGGDSDKPVLAVAPCSRWPSKTWPPVFFRTVIERLHEQLAGRLAVWLMGGPGDRAALAEIATGLPSGVRDLGGRLSWPASLAMLRRSDMVMANDSGPLHLAAALGVPTVAVFGPTSPARTGPYGPIHRVFRGDVPCAPCFHPECPLSEQICQPAVSANEVVAYLAESLSTARTRT